MITVECNRYYFFEHEGEAIGSCTCFPSKHLPKAVELWAFGLQGNCRGRGLGQQFLREVIELHAGKTIVLFVEKKNARAIHIYEKAGFQIVGEYRGGSFAWEMRLAAPPVRFD